MERELNLELNYEGFEECLVKTHLRDHPDSCDDPYFYRRIQYIFRFENGYGASVIKDKYSYGGERDLWELAVIYFESGDTYHLCYDTPITDDVIGYLTDDEVRKILKNIKELQY